MTLFWRWAAPFVLAATLSGCVSFPPAPEARVAPRISGERLVVADGAALGLSVWRAADPIAAILAVHGMNDYAGHFADFGQWASAKAGLSVYAYDQRGFGRSPQFGRWVGEKTLAADLRSAIAAMRTEHPGLPIYVLGHSMGAAVVMAAAGEETLDVDGAILVAPGVWGASQMPIFYRLSANVAASLAPSKTLTGERAGRQASDNIEALREMYKDPYVIKPTRLDAVLGVARVMGTAYDRSNEIGGRILLLTGEKDEIIPPRAQRRAAGRLCGAVDQRLYAEGWHLLLRDLQAEKVWRDVATWIAANGGTAGNQGAAGRQIGPAALSCASKAD
jgi:alpha-beta hydrolase superfamily lysophospholipase